MNQLKSGRGQLMLMRLVFLFSVVVVAVLFCFVQIGNTACIMGELPDPVPTAKRFFDSLCSGDYDVCDGCISDFASLGLGDTPENSVAALVYPALLESYSYSFLGNNSVNGDEAIIPVSFTYFNVAAAVSDLDNLAVDAMYELVQSYENEEELFDENGAYKQELIDEVYGEVAQKILGSSDKYMTTTELRVYMRYDGGWKIEITNEMMVAFSGGIM